MPIIRQKMAFHVRMGWAVSDVINLTNKEGLPASPFRTDQEEIPTHPPGE